MLEIINGIATGLLLSSLIGPVFFSLIQTSIEEGVRAGILMALGISLSDLIFVTIAYFGTSLVSFDPEFRSWMALGSGLVMIGFGLRSFTKPVPQKGVSRFHQIPKNNLIKILKGFVLNFLNPLVLLFWIGVVGMVSIKWGYTGNKVLIFLASLLITILSMDISKAILAGKLRKIITPRMIRIINRLVGISFIFLGARLMYYAFHTPESSGHLDIFGLLYSL